MGVEIEVAHGNLRVAVGLTDQYRRLCFSGIVEDATLVARLEEIWRAPGYAFDRPELYDMRDTVRTEVTSSGIHSAAALDLELFENAPPIRVAILVSKELEFGLSRMFEGYIARREHLIKVVTTIEGAEAWLRPSGETL